LIVVRERFSLRATRAVREGKSAGAAALRGRERLRAKGAMNVQDVSIGVIPPGRSSLRRRR
jgi:hypothetical protein